MNYVQAFWLLLLSGFSSAILFFIWKNLAGYSRIGLGQFWSIITQKIGDDKNDLGILALSLALLCWFISGLFSLVPHPFTSLLATSVCSSLNSCFLLLFLRHLDKEDLPAPFRAYFPTRHTIWTVFIMVVLVTLIIAGALYSALESPGSHFFILLPDLAFSLYTLYFIGLSFFYLLTARIKSRELGILSAVPILVTLLAEIFHLLSLRYTGWNFMVANQTLLFTYKPLLIISYFVLIYSWQLKRINRTQDRPRTETQLATSTHTDVLANRLQYRMLGTKDWLILESLARGEKATSIAAAYPSEFPNGAKGVDDRIGAIAREFQLSGQSQMKIVVTALKRGLLRLEDIP